MAQVSCDAMLKKCGAIMYDLEIVSCVPEHGVVRDPTLWYCGGWEDYAGMGISVITAYDFVEAIYRVFLQDNLNDFKLLVNSRNIIIGFNNARFDDNVLAANGIHIEKGKSWDLWKAITKTQPEGQRRGYKLNDLLKANNLASKTGLGSEAPKWAQKGQWGRNIDYCLSDTTKQVNVLRLACNGVLINPNGGGYMTIKPPWEEIEVETGGLFQ